VNILQPVTCQGHSRPMSRSQEDKVKLTGGERQGHSRPMSRSQEDKVKLTEGQRQGHSRPKLRFEGLTEASFSTPSAQVGF